jgi:hypothetical protein
MTVAQKTPLSRTLPRFTQQKVLDEIEKRGYSLPGHVVSVSGAIVTVAFDVTAEDGSALSLPQVTIPLLGPEYIRYPIQAGDLGVAWAASASLAGISGLGASSVTNALPANLSSLVWIPCGNKSWSSVDANALTLYGPNGVVMRDSDSKTVGTLTPDGFTLTAQTSITLQVGSHSVVINSSGVTIDGKDFLTHGHVATGGTPPLTAPSGGGPVTGDTGAVA